MKLPRILCIAGLVGALGSTGSGVWFAQSGEADRPPELGPNASSTPPPQRDAQGPRALLGSAIRSIDAAHTVAAGTLVRGCVFDRPLVGSGAYWERKGDRGVQYRWEMKFQIGDETVSFVQVCNGRYLWISRAIGRKESIDRIDVERVMEALGNDPRKLPPNSKYGSWLLLGGLGKMLASLDYAFEFDSVEETRLDRDMPALRLEGRWKPAVLEKLLPEPKKVIESGKIAKPEKLPPQFPHTVSVCLEKGVLIPRRIEYVRRLGRVDDVAAEYVTLAAIDFVDVALDQPISESVVFKRESAAQEMDRTEQFLANLGLKRESATTSELPQPESAKPSARDRKPPPARRKPQRDNTPPDE